MSSEIEKNNNLENNKHLVEKFIELTWNQGRFNLARNLVRRDFNYHANLVNRTLDYDMTALLIQQIRQSMEDFEVIIEDVVAEGGKVITQSLFCGTLIKPMFGFQPTKNVVNFAAVSFWEIKKGHIHSLNTILDTAELTRQMNYEGKRLELDLTGLESH